MDPRLREAVSRLEVRLSQNAIPQKGSQGWNEAIEMGKTVTNDLDAMSNARGSLGVPRWVNFVGLLQKLAYIDPDSGAEPDIASWCERQWADVLQAHPQNVPALQGKSYSLICLGRPPGCHVPYYTNSLTRPWPCVASQMSARSSPDLQG